MDQTNFNYYEADNVYGALFFQFPKVLMYGEQYKNLSDTAKLAYMVLKDRLEYSLRNHWVDEEGHVYFIFTNKELENLFNCHNQKVIKIKNELTKEVFSNIVLAEEIIKETSKLGIKNYTFSFLENGIHDKVDRRFSKYEWKIITPDLEEKEKTYTWLKEKAAKYNVNIEACCVVGLKESRCIDGYLLNELHDLDKSVDLKEPRKRNLCACTNSIDIGGWPPKRCFSGCKYCYANAEL